MEGQHQSPFQLVSVNIRAVLSDVINKLESTEYSETSSLRSSRFRFLQAKRGKRARALGKKEQKGRSGGEGPLPPRSYLFAPFCPMPSRAYPAWLEGLEATATQAMEPRFNEVAGDRPNLFVKLRVRYIENLA